MSLFINRQRRKDTHNSDKIILSVTNVLLAPIFMLLSTPLINARFGPEVLAIWFIFMTFSSMGYLLNLGISDASLQFINNSPSIQRIIWKKILLSVLAIVLLGFIALLNIEKFVISTVYTHAKHVIYIIVAKLILEQIDLHVGAFLKVSRKFRENLTFDVYAKIATYCVGLYSIYINNDLRSFFIVALICTIIKLWYKLKYSHNEEIYENTDTRNFEKFSNKKFYFASISFFIMAFNGFTISFFERFFLPNIFDLVTISQITIATQITFFIHSLPAAGMSFILPLMSGKKLNYSLLHLFGISLSLSILMFIAVNAFAEFGLPLWLPSESEKIEHYIRILAPPFFVYSLCIVPYYKIMASYRGMYLSLLLFSVSIIFMAILILAANTELSSVSFIHLKLTYLYASGVCIYGYFFFSKAFQKKH